MDQESMKFFENLFRSLETEMGQRFDQMGQRFDRMEVRLDRLENTLALHGRRLGAGARAIAGLSE